MKPWQMVDETSRILNRRFLLMPYVPFEEEVVL